MGRGHGWRSWEYMAYLLDSVSEGVNGKKHSGGLWLKCECEGDRLLVREVHDVQGRP